MGREVEKILNNRDHELVACIDPIIKDADSKTLTKELALRSEVVIEFALAHDIGDRVSRYVEYGINAIIATTGWSDQLAEITALVENSNIGLVYGPNFSVGANIFFKIVEIASQLINQFAEYDILAYEIHHKNKKDSPSGTAHTIGNIILKNSRQKNRLLTDKLERVINHNELHLASVRGGYIPGIHTVLLDSEADTIELTHSARNRSGFALGAVLAAEWVKGKKGIFEFKDFLKQMIKIGR